MVVPLHVFEPRYRQMVSDAVERGRMIAVCHTKKKIRSAKDGQTMEDALNNNQATYQPYDVFSAGQCEIVDKTSDGRVYAQVSMSKRLKFVNEVQTLPYRIATCSELKDTGDLVSSEELQRSQTATVDALHNLIKKDNSNSASGFDREEWLERTPEQFSFEVFQLVHFEADVMQSVLEQTSPLQRLQTIEALICHGMT